MDLSPPPHEPDDATAGLPPDAPPSVAVPLAPVSASQRIAELDVLRGVAVLGIFVVNVAYMAFPTGTFEVWAWEDLSWPDRLVRAGIEFFAELKFITLFSLLFGMGLVLQLERAERAGRAFARVYARRLGVLFLIGVLHGVLLWYGDILAAYALLGFVALYCCRYSTRALAVFALLLMLGPLAIMGTLAAVYPESLAEAGVDWSTEAEILRQDVASGEVTGDELAATEWTIRFYEFMASEEEVYRYGTFGEILFHRSVMFLVGLIALMLTFSGRILAMFLLGICLVRMGMFVDPSWPAARYRSMVVIGLLWGLPLQVAALAIRLTSSDEALPLFLQFAALYLGSLGMAAAYAGLVGLWCRWRRASSLQHRLAAVGRMALTNYLMQSFFAALVFHSYGLALFGTLAYWQTMLVVAAVAAFQLIVSPWWLARFQFGPVEGLWRWSVYGHWHTAAATGAAAVASSDQAAVPHQRSD